MSILHVMSYPISPVLLALSGNPVLGILSWDSLYWQSSSASPFSDCPVLPILCCLSSSAFPVLPVLAFLSLYINMHTHIYIYRFMYICTYVYRGVEQNETGSGKYELEN
jgi:hypothetical protein